MKRWSLRQVASESGRAIGTVNVMALAGLVPGYKGQGIPEELARPFATVLRSGAHTARLAHLLREEPQAVLEAGEGLKTLARAQMAYKQRDVEREAA